MLAGFVSLSATSVACVPAATSRRAAAPKTEAPALTQQEEADVDREVADRLANAPPLTYWRPLGVPGGSAGSLVYLAPKDGFVADDGGVDVIVHFHQATLADREWRKSGTSAVVISAAYAYVGGSGPYRDAFADAERLNEMLKDVTERVHATHVRRLALVSFSAGYGAIGQILDDPRYYAMVDAVILLDSLHADYTDSHAVDTSTLGGILRFAKDAADGKKAMFVTHSSIVPPDYASTTETAAVLCEAAGAPLVSEVKTNDRGMIEKDHADRGGFHVRGYRGEGPKDHMDQLSLVGRVARETIVTRWARFDALAHRATTKRTSLATQ